MKAANSAALLALAPLAAAYWRLGCQGVAGVAMIDPIADPNVTAAHAHTIKGGSGLSVSSNAADLLKSDCTSCQVSQDKSAYWAPQLYFQNKNGSTMIVPEVANHLTYYKYTPVYNDNGTLMLPEALPNDLRIISGDKLRRNFTLAVPDPPRPWSGKDATQDALAQKAIGFNCLNYAGKAEDTLYRHFLPDKNYLETQCPDGIRMEILFPQCWNGKLDSDDHQSHMAFPDAGIDGGKCPKGYDHNIMQILFETIYPTKMFTGVDGTYALSTGDATGYSYHGDILVAWEEGVLQQALDQCGSDTTGPGKDGITQNCPVFKINTDQQMQQCKLASNAVSKVGGFLNLDKVLDKMPGVNPMQYGPQQATMPSGMAATNAAAASTAKVSNAPAPSAPVVPTLSYSAGSAHIFVAANTPAANTPVAAASPSTTLVQSVITPAPVANSPAAANPQLTTVTYTSNGAVYHEVIVENDVVVTKQDVVTVTQMVPGYGQKKRDHRARHAHGDFHLH